MSYTNQGLKLKLLDGGTIYVNSSALSRRVWLVISELGHVYLTPSEAKKVAKALLKEAKGTKK